MKWLVTMVAMVVATVMLVLQAPAVHAEQDSASKSVSQAWAETPSQDVLEKVQELASQPSQVEDVTNESASVPVSESADDGIGNVVIVDGQEELPTAQVDDLDGVEVAQGEQPEPQITQTNEGIIYEALPFKGDITDFLKMLSTISQKNIIPSSKVTGTVTVNLFDVTFEEALDAVLTANSLAYEEKGPFIFVYTQKEMEEIEEAARKMESRVFRLNYIPAMDVQTLISTILSADAKVTTSPDAGSPKDKSGENWAGSNFIVVTDYPEYLEKVAAIVKQLDVRPPQVLIEATIMVANLDDTNELGIDLSYLGGIDEGFFLGTGVAADSQSGTNGGFFTEFSANVGEGGVSVGITNNNVGVLIRALESITDVVTLGNPKVLALNRQMGKVIVGNRDGYITTEVSATTATQTVEFLETGTQLEFRPFVMEDGYIRMELNPKDSDGGVKVEGSFTLPSESTAEVTTNVLVKDGQTIVIGGLFREKTTITKSQVPLMGSIPVLGHLFKSTSDVVAKEEVIFLITPHIVKEPIDYAAGKKVREDCDYVALGLREGLMGTGREKLAAAHYNVAREQKEAGRYGAALWNAQVAASMSPAFLDAVKLREQLMTEHAYVGEFGSMRLFLRRMLEEEAK
jgi:type IV pilus assembly protein PilQ